MYKQVLLLFTIYTATCKLSRDHTFILNAKFNDQSFQLLQFSGTMTVLSHGEWWSNDAQIVFRGIISYSIFIYLVNLDKNSRARIAQSF